MADREEARSSIREAEARIEGDGDHRLLLALYYSYDPFRFAYPDRAIRDVVTGPMPVYTFLGLYGAMRRDDRAIVYEGRFGTADEGIPDIISLILTFHWNEIAYTLGEDLADIRRRVKLPESGTDISEDPDGWFRESVTHAVMTNRVLTDHDWDGLYEGLSEAIRVSCLSYKGRSLTEDRLDGVSSRFPRATILIKRHRGFALELFELAEDYMDASRALMEERCPPEALKGEGRLPMVWGRDTWDWEPRRFDERTDLDPEVQERIEAAHRDRGGRAQREVRDPYDMSIR